MMINKMKKIILFTGIVVFGIIGCESFLDTDNLTKKDNSNFPVTPTDAFQSLTGIYSAMTGIDKAGCLFMVGEVMSDVRFGGGGTDDRFIQAVSRFKKTGEDMFASAWEVSYMGIYRCNMLLQSLDQVDWDSEVQRDKVESETRFMRAYFYFDLARMFGPVPLILETAPINIPRTQVDEVYAQIAGDLKYAIEHFEAIKFQDMQKSELGHANKWAAQGLMARVFLFYTGYYNKESLPLTSGEGITKNEIIGWIDDCVINSGHDLWPDFRNLWPYAYASEVYAYARDNNLEWVDETGDNCETVFAQKYYANAGWEDWARYSNALNVFFGLRIQPDYRNTLPFGEGWGWGTVNPNFWNEWPDNDLRKKASILNVDDPDEGITFTWAGDRQTEETGFWQKKYMPIYILDEWGNPVNYSAVKYGTNNSQYMLNNTQDMIIIRFADILLMGAELGSSHAQDYLDRVRNRVNLPSVTVTLENIKRERHFELAFEGVRYYDLLRWHDEDLITVNKTDVPVKNNNVLQTISVKFRPETGGFLPIPQRQISLSNGVLTQNPGWEGTGNMY
jgi:hypothetical protein